MKKTAIVLGATGLVGGHLVKLLAKADHIGTVVAISRKPIHYESNKVHNAVVDFDNLIEHKDAFKGDILFSCLGTTLKQAGSVSKQRIVDFDYQYQVAKMASDVGLTHYLLVSSNSANEHSVSSYLKMKGELESAVKKLPFKHISILQPSLLLGDRQTPRIAEGLASLFMPKLCKLPGLKRYRPIEGKEVAQKLLNLSIMPNAKLEVLNLDQVFV